MVCPKVWSVNTQSPTLEGWLSTPLGRSCIAAEQRLVRRVLEHVFGEQFLQIGLWGSQNTFLRYTRTQRATLIDWRPGTGAQLRCDPHAIAIATDSVDAVLLPHTLELAPSPHALLREVDRVLRADGHIVVLSFKSSGFWGLRHLLCADGYPPGHQRLILETRLRDWLQLLSFEIDEHKRYCHTLPFEKISRFGSFPKEEWASRWLPALGGGFLLRAQKRIHPMTPLKPKWHSQRLKVVGGLVEPTTRSQYRRRYE
jgi:SAM-dependent methyltransferase